MATTFGLGAEILAPIGLFWSTLCCATRPIILSLLLCAFVCLSVYVSMETEKNASYFSPLDGIGRFFGVWYAVSGLPNYQTRSYVFDLAPITQNSSPPPIWNLPVVKRFTRGQHCIKRAGDHVVYRLNMTESCMNLAGRIHLGRVAGNTVWSHISDSFPQFHLAGCKLSFVPNFKYLGK